MQHCNLIYLIILMKAGVAQFVEDSDLVENIRDALQDSSSECETYEQCESQKLGLRKEIIEESEDTGVECANEYGCTTEYEPILPSSSTSNVTIPINAVSTITSNTTTVTLANSTSVIPTLHTSLPKNNLDTGIKNQTTSTISSKPTPNPTLTQMVSTVSTKKLLYDQQKCVTPDEQTCILD